MTQATPTKLRSGAWGARTSRPVNDGDIIQITTRAGKTWDAVVDRVVWTDGKVSICATGPAPQRQDRRGGICDECERSARRLTECADSNGAMGMCCPICARQSRYERSFG